MKKPLSAPVRDVCSMDMFVQAPVMMIVSRPRPASRVSSFVPCQALIRIFSTMRSPSFGSSPSAGAAPQVPRTSAFPSFTPLKSGAFSLSPGAPSSTRYQTWITGTPLLRHVSASAATFSTTFCSFACSGAPESAKAPPSIITSFCRSWINITQRDASRLSPSSFIDRLLTHVRLAPRSDSGLDRVERGRARDVERVPVLAAPREVPRVLGDENRSEMPALGGDDPDAARPGHPDAPALVALHPVGDALLDDAGADALEEHAAVRDVPVAVRIPDLDVRARRVDAVEQRIVGREAEPVRQDELVLVDDELELVLTASGGNPEDALPAELALPLDAETGEAAVPGIGEVDRPRRVDADVVRAVQVLALEVVCEHLAAPVGTLAPQRARHVLADDEVEVGVVRHAVALERRPHHLDDGAVGRVAAPHVAGHVGEEEMVLGGMPDRPLREREAGGDPLDFRPFLDELVDRVRLRLDTEACFGARHRAPFRQGMTSGVSTRL